MKAYTFTSGINAYTLYKAAKALGINVYTTEREPLLPIPCRTPDQPDDWLLFTEESTLTEALKGDQQGQFLPTAFPLALLDDKWAFAEWLASQPDLCNGLTQWPLHTAEQVRYPCLLKAKHSWQGSNKLPRGWVCYTENDVVQYLEHISAAGLTPQSFFFTTMVRRHSPSKHLGLWLS